MLTPSEMYALGAFCILEGSPELSDTHEQLKVAAVVVNRLNADNWVDAFGSRVFDQLFAPGQFEVRPRYGLDPHDFDSLDEATRALADAKDGLDTGRAEVLMIAFMRAAADPVAYSDAARAVGDNTGFRGSGGRNTFRVESPYDEADLGSQQPRCILVDWPGGDNPFF